MSNTYNTNKRRVVNRRDHVEWDYQFDGERYGNARRYQAEMKVRQRRTDRARSKTETRRLIAEI